LALDVFCGNFAKTTNTTVPVDQAITGVGFTSKLVIPYASLRTADGIAGEDSAIMFGASDGTNDSVACAISEDAVGTMNSSHYQSNSECVAIPVVSGTTPTSLATMKSLDSDGFTLTWGTNTAVATKINFICLGGTDLEVEVGELAIQSGTGVKNYTTTLKSADMVFLFSAGADGAGDNSVFFIGAGKTSTNRWSYSLRNDDGAASSEAEERFSQTHIMQMISAGAGGLIDSYDLDELDATNGIKLDQEVKGGATRVVQYILLKGANLDFSLGSETMPTGTGTQATTVTGTPKVLMNFPSFVTTLDANKDDIKTGIGGTDGTNQNAIAFSELGAAADPSDVGGGNESDETLLVTTPPATLEKEANISSFNDGDFTLDYTTANATAGFFGWWTIGGPAALPVATPKLINNALIF